MILINITLLIKNIKIILLYHIGKQKGSIKWYEVRSM